MRAVVQRVYSAECTVDGEITGTIDEGLVVFQGIGEGDGKGEIDYLVDKILGLRIFEDEDGKMNVSLRDSGGGILLIPQFTLYGDVSRGKRPSFNEAAPPEKAEELYERTIEVFREDWDDVQTGRFAEMMDITVENDGPVTILIDTDE
ncbi:MAG: D-aminoacyl-tRNA deacylase [bacterium]